MLCRQNYECGEYDCDCLTWMQTTPLRVKEVAKSMQGRATKSDGMFSGRCTLEGTQVCHFLTSVTKYATLQVLGNLHNRAAKATYASVDVAWLEQVEGAVIYPGSRPTVLRIRLRYLARFYSHF